MVCSYTKKAKREKYGLVLVIPFSQLILCSLITACIVSALPSFAGRGVTLDSGQMVWVAGAASPTAKAGAGSKWPDTRSDPDSKYGSKGSVPDCGTNSDVGPTVRANCNNSDSVDMNNNHSA